MTAPAGFDEGAAVDALARADDGADPLPGDPELIAAYDRRCEAEWCRREQDRAEANLAVWLATQCGGCEDGGTGDACDDHEEDTDE